MSADAIRFRLFFFVFVRGSSDSREGGGLEGDERERSGGWSFGIFGNFGDDVGSVRLEVNEPAIPRCDVESPEDQAGAIHVDVIADEGVDDFHERRLNGFLIFKHGDGMDARLGRSAHTADHALMEIAKSFFAERGRATADSVDFDVGAVANCLSRRH